MSCFKFNQLMAEISNTAQGKVSLLKQINTGIATYKLMTYRGAVFSSQEAENSHFHLAVMAVYLHHPYHHPFLSDFQTIH